MAIDTPPWWAQYATPIAVAMVASGAAIGDILRRVLSGHTRAETELLHAQTDETESRLRTPEERANAILLGTIEALRKQIEQSEARATARDLAATAREQELLARIAGLESTVADLKRQIEAGASQTRGWGQ